MPHSRRDRLTELVAINRALAAATDYDALLRLVVDRTAELLDAETTVLLLADEHGRATIPASRGLDPAIAAAFHASFDERIGEKICAAIGCAAERFLAAPVIEAGVVRGLLAVFCRTAPSGEDEAAMLSALADQVAIALGGAIYMRRLEQALVLLRDADRRKDEFLGILSHELRNPLAPIMSAIFLLNRAEPHSDAAARARDIIERQTAHLKRLVDDLLDVTRIARGIVTISRELINVTDVVRRSAEDHRSTLSERGLRLHLEIPEHAAWVLGDATRIAQVIGNLLHNAGKFTPPGGEVWVAVRPGESKVEIRVRDTGTGIDPRLHRHVFEPFAQSEQTLARDGGGLGLGLPLVKAVVQLHGGTVEVASDGAGKGSEFVVCLPLVAPPSAIVMPAARTRSRVCAKRVLVVDDNRDAAESLARLVGMFGHTAFVAHDGPSAVEMIRASPPDAVLCDIGLPGMDGYELARLVREHAPNGMRLIAVSGYAQPEDVKRAMECGFDAHVPKPPDPGEIDRLLG